MAHRLVDQVSRMVCYRFHTRGSVGPLWFGIRHPLSGYRDSHFRSCARRPYLPTIRQSSPQKSYSGGRRGEGKLPSLSRRPQTYFGVIEDYCRSDNPTWEIFHAETLIFLNSLQVTVPVSTICTLSTRRLTTTMWLTRLKLTLLL